jgi:hypothetical protein
MKQAITALKILFVLIPIWAHADRNKTQDYDPKQVHINEVSNELYKMAAFEAVSVSTLVGSLKADTSDTNKLWEEEARLKRIGGIAVHSQRSNALEKELALKSAIKKALVKFLRNPMVGGFALVGTVPASIGVITAGTDLVILKSRQRSSIEKETREEATAR